MLKKNLKIKKMDENNLPEEIKKRKGNPVEDNIISDNGNIDKANEDKIVPEKILEHLEPLLEEIEQISNEIEERGDEILENAQNTSLIAKNMQIFKELYEKSEFFLKQMSRQLANYPKEVADSFRDKTISKKSLSVRKKILNNKSIKKFIDLKGSNKKIDKEFFGVKEKARYAHSTIYKNSVSLLGKIENGDWGNSKNKNDAIQNANYLLELIVKNGISFESYDEVFEIMRIYENSSALMSSGVYSNFGNIISLISNHFYEKTNSENNEEISKYLRNDPYLIIKYLDTKKSNSNSHEDSDFLEKQLDEIIENYPEDSCNNWDINKNFKKILKSNPEKYAAEPRSRRFIFESLKSSSVNNDRNYFEDNSYFFNKELSCLGKEEVEKIIDSYHSYDMKNQTTQMFLSSLDLDEKDFEKVFDKLERNYPKEEHETYSKACLLEYFKKGDTLFVPLFKYRQFNLSPEERVDFFKKSLDTCSNDTRFILFFQTLSNFKDVFWGIPEDKCDEIFQELINKSINGGIEQIRTFHALLPEYDIPPKYREQINQVFSKKYSENSDRINKIFSSTRNSNEESVKFSKNEEWLMKNEEITPKLELEFYEKGSINELRHFFFQVIEGERKSVNKNLLINKYAERIYEFNPEEFIDLFLIRKKIPLSYSDIFIKKINSNNSDSLFLQLDDGLRLGQISKEEYDGTLLNFVSAGKYNFADKSLGICLEKKIVNESEREALFEYYIHNIIKQASLNDNINFDTLRQMMEQKLLSGNIKEEEKKFLLNRFFNGLLKYDNLHNYILKIEDRNMNLFKTAFSDKKEKDDFIEKLLGSNNDMAIGELLRIFLRDVGVGQKEEDDPISFLIKGKFDTLFEHSLSLDNLGVDIVLVDSFHLLDKDKQEILLKYFLSKEDILANNKRGNDIKTFCSVLAYKIQDDKEKEDQSKRVISDEDAKNIFSKIFLSQFINEETFTELMQYRKSFLLGNKDIMNQYASSVEKKGGYRNCLSALQAFRSQEKSFLSIDQVKSLSSKVLDNINIDESIYQMYLDSKSGNLFFSLDQEKFNKNIKRMIEGYNDIDIASTLDFIKLQRNEKNKNDWLEGGNDKISLNIVLSKEQEEALGKKILKGEMSAVYFEKFYDLDKILFNKLLDDTLNSNNLNNTSLRNLLLTKEEISDNLFSKIINYYFDPAIDKAQYIFDSICDRYGASPNSLQEIKNKVDNLPNIENRSIFKSKLLQKDLLSQEELKVFYDEIRSEPNIQSQVLLSAEVLGSLVYANQQENGNALLEAESDETKKNIEHISSFVKKYSLESKGRTIAVMLFSKEYLPERSMGEVIEKVASALSKYERILDQYAYKGIPDGLNASIGLEYEITNSTALGYKEVTDRQLKNDIVRLSNAAHIGNGKDAVHEIATRPATNPYLLLLEMQMLDYLKYIDLNFDYSPSYQKGARGYHLTIGGEKGLNVNANTNFLQNSILAASWGGVHAGETGMKVSGGRGVTLRGRNADGGNNNIKVFEKATNSVELRSLSIDKMEPFQRAIVTAYHGAIAIQALEKFTDCTSDVISNYFKSDSVVNSEQNFIQKLRESNKLKEGYENNEKYVKIIYAWAELSSSIKDALDYHNNEFLKGETTGYLNKDGVWVDSADFGGSYNSNRFDSVVSSIDSTLSVEEYLNSTKMYFNEFFSSFDVELADNLTKINNLYLKPGNKAFVGNNKEKVSLGGDQANAISMLEVTKFNNEDVEYRTDSSYLRGTVFDTLGERREGYYYVQGGSEKMITHACQIALLNFNKKMEEILKN